MRHFLEHTINTMVYVLGKSLSTSVRHFLEHTINFKLILEQRSIIHPDFLRECEYTAELYIFSIGLGYIKYIICTSPHTTFLLLLYMYTYIYYLF